MKARTGEGLWEYQADAAEEHPGSSLFVRGRQKRTFLPDDGDVGLPEDAALCEAAE